MGDKLGFEYPCHNSVDVDDAIARLKEIEAELDPPTTHAVPTNPGIYLALAPPTQRSTEAKQKQRVLLGVKVQGAQEGMLQDIHDSCRQQFSMLNNQYPPSVNPTSTKQKHLEK
eukprot:TRINITY_DN67026_c0_g1_i1.p1 TRINITY_DN67026_c0_g1~~TRINITY_DN67026_c0_g1_i1.p1  ORF type:complete len:114 (+),score=14.58 TRINITY_DN67026_c0_g1_i1:33-374(+)